LSRGTDKNEVGHLVNHNDNPIYCENHSEIKNKNSSEKLLTISRKSDIILIEKEKRSKTSENFFKKNPEKVLTDFRKSDIIKTTKKQGDRNSQN